MSESRPEQPKVAIVFSPLTPLLGGYDEQQSRNAMHEALAGYHRMFFERNLAVEVLSSRELAEDNLQQYKLVIVPYPLMLTEDESKALAQYVSAGGHLFLEARPGWVDERGHAQPRIPGFGWDKILRIRGEQVIPVKELKVRWDGAEFKAMVFREQFDAGSPVKPVAFAEDGSPIAYESHYDAGSTILFGSFAGQQNYQHPVSMHPLAGILAQWAGLRTPDLHAPPLLELREMHAPAGRWVFFFNHGDVPASVEFARTLEKPATHVREVMTGQIFPTGNRLDIKTEVPPASVRVYRIDY